MRLWKAAVAAISVLVVAVACQPTKPPPPGGGGDGGGGGGGSGSGGNGFDACTAPSTDAMSAWLQSPYRFVGVYIGGANRACAQPNLTASWVATVHGQGYGLIPTYLGDQAWCTFASDVILMPTGDLTGAHNRGRSQGSDAVDQAGALGLGLGTPIYFDMEGYDTSAPGCTDSVRAFMSGWIAALHERGYLAAMYSSSESGVRDMANVQSDPAYQLDAIWFANWNGNPGLSDPFFPDSVWPNARIHQFQGDHDESWGGVIINIDSDAVGGPTG